MPPQEGKTGIKVPERRDRVVLRAFLMVLTGSFANLSLLGFEVLQLYAFATIHTIFVFVWRAEAAARAGR